MQNIISESNGPHVLLIEPTKQKHREDLTKSTSVVLAKYSLKVKLERISTTLECQSWEN